MKRDRIRQTVIDRERKRDRNRERTDRGRERRPERVETGFCHIAMGDLYVMAVFIALRVLRSQISTTALAPKTSFV